MNRVMSSILLALVALLAVTSSIAEAKQSRDDAAIRDVEAQQAEAWNRHDAKAYADLFAKDGDVVNVVGWWWQNRAEIEYKLNAGFAFVFRQSQMTIADVEIRYLNPTIAIAHVRWTMTGAKTPPRIPEPRIGIQLQVLQKQHGKWLIASFQNTNCIPEMPFPQSAPSAHGG